MQLTRFVSTLAITGALTLAAASPAFAQAPATSYGTLDEGDQVDARGRHMAAQMVQLYAGQFVDIALQSQQFDPLLWVVGPDGTMVAMNDDAPGEGLNSRVRFRVAQTGAFRVVVSSYQPGETGSYRLTLARTGAPVARPVDPDDDGAYGNPGADSDGDDDGEAAPARRHWNRGPRGWRRNGW